MNQHPRSSGRRLAALALCLALTPLAASAANKPAPKFDPRAIGGAWDRYPSLGQQVDPSVLPPPPDQPRAPLKPEYLGPYLAHQKEVAAANAAGAPIATGYTHCLPDGMPSMMMGMFPLEVIQSQGRVTIIEEAYNQVRRIYLDEKQIPIDDAEPGFFGHSVGHWEGNTLVVDTVGIKDIVRVRDVPHSDQMRVSERIHLIKPGFMQDTVTVTDPVYLTGPWTWTWEYQAKPGYKLYEYVCEDNREYADPVTGQARLRVDPAK